MSRVKTLPGFDLCNSNPSSVCFRLEQHMPGDSMVVANVDYPPYREAGLFSPSA